MIGKDACLNWTSNMNALVRVCGLSLFGVIFGCEQHSSNETAVTVKEWVYAVPLEESGNVNVWKQPGANISQIIS